MEILIRACKGHFPSRCQSLWYLYACAALVLAGCGGDGSGDAGIKHSVGPTSSSAPVLTIESSYDTFGQVRGTLKDEEYIYVADGTVGLVVLQLSSENRLSMIASLALTGSGRAYSLAKSANYLYMATRSEGVHVIDVSDPSDPILAKTLTTEDNASYLVIDQNRLYISAAGTLSVADITDPANPVILGSVSGVSNNQHLVVEDNKVFIAAYTAGLRIVDAIDPAAPVILSETRVHNSDDIYYNISAIAKKGHYVYVGGDESGVLVYDVSSLKAPKLVKQVALSGNPTDAEPYPPYSMTVWKNFLFVADGSDGIRVLDITMPRAPVLKFSQETAGSVQDLCIDGRFLVAAVLSSGVQVIDIFETTDMDSDGIMDGEDAFPEDPMEWFDTDGDGIGNNEDEDDDNDGVLDTEDAFPLDASECVDTDGDGVGDNSDAFRLDPLEYEDTDKDGIGNNADSDDDNDGTLDENDAFPLDPYNIICITCSGETKLNRSPKLSGDKLVWRGYSAEGKPHNYLYNLNTHVQVVLPDHNLGFVGPASLDNSRVVWREWDKISLFTLFLWDSSQTITIREYPIGNFTMPWGYPPSYGSIEPTINNGCIAWAEWDGNDYEIFMWDGSVVTQLTDNSYDDYEPQIYNGQISWTGLVDDKADVFFWDGVTIRNISSRPYIVDEDSHLMNGMISWCGRTGSEYGSDIFFWDGGISTVINLPGEDYEPQIDSSGKFITWHNRNNNQYDIYVWDKHSVVPFATSPSKSELEPYADNERIAFVIIDENGSNIYVGDYSVDKDGDGVVNSADAYPLDPTRW